MHIDRCYCHQTLFADMKPIADATGATTVPTLQAHADFGNGCQLCHPYVRRMLRTGETVFHEIVTAQDEPDVCEVG